MCARGAAILALAAIAIGCGQSGGSGASGSPPPAPPTEKWTEVTSDGAPWLTNPSEPFPPPQILRRGELLRVGASAQVATWKGLVDDVEVTRDGMVFKSQRSKDGGVAYAFQSDLGGEVTVSATSWLCGELAKQPLLNTASCASTLRRAKTVDGAVVSHMECGYGVCPVALEKDGKLASIGVDGLTAAHFLNGKKKSLFVVEARKVKDEGKASSSSIEVITLDGAPVRAATYPGDDIDSHDPDHVISKVVTLTFTRTALHLKGKREEYGPGGKVLATQPIDETHALPPLD